MPTYVYHCKSCGRTFERRQKMSDPPLTRCPECRGRIHRVFQPVPILFKGPGFYATDSRNAGTPMSRPDNGGEPKERDEGQKEESKTDATLPD